MSEQPDALDGSGERSPVGSNSGDLVPLRAKGPSSQTFTPEGLLEVWDGEDWTPVRAITATRRRTTDPDHRPAPARPRRPALEPALHGQLARVAGPVGFRPGGECRQGQPHRRPRRPALAARTGLHQDRPQAGAAARPQRSWGGLALLPE